MGFTHFIRPNEKTKLRKIDPADTAGLDKEQAEARSEELGKELSDLQELLFAAGTHALLIVLQGRDTSGKDGAIRHLLKWMNAQSTVVHPFKVPTPEELSHDFLWRVHHACPGKGDCTVFNRSHYEDVLVVRVHELVPEETWRKRYDHINHFEKLLADSNTIILKFLLHISMEEQEERLLEREAEVAKAWKLSVGDWKEREHWDAYTDAFDEMLDRCSTDYAPWEVVPANKKWFRNLAITESIVERLRPFKETWLDSLEETGRKAKAELAEYRASRA